MKYFFKSEFTTDHLQFLQIQVINRTPQKMAAIIGINPLSIHKSTQTAKWLEYCTTNLQVMGTNMTYTCVCGVFP